MSKIILIVFAILTLALSCNHSTKTSKQNFSDYLHKIDPITLPFQTGCNDYSKFRITEKYLALVDTNYAVSCQIPFKRIENKKNVTAVIYLSPADIYTPVLKTFDSFGKEISSLQFFSNCSGEPGFVERQFVEINQDFQIIKTDSVWRWELDSNHFVIDSTKKIQITRTTYEIGVNGAIITK